MKNSAIIIYQHRNQGKFMKAFGDLVQEKRVKINRMIRGRICDSTYCYAVIGDEGFGSYSLFDSFCFFLASKFNNLFSIGLFLGHWDKEGYFWSDYNSSNLLLKRKLKK